VHEEDAWGWYASCIKNKCVKDSYINSAVGVAALAYHNKIMKFYEKYVDVFIAPSIFMKNLMVKYGWDSKKIIHIPSPLDSNEFSFGEEDNGTVVYSGRLSEEKGIPTLIEAAARTPEIPYKIIGAGPLEKELKLLVVQKNIHNVEFLGFKTGTELIDLLQQARFLVVPSIWYENGSLSVLEGKASGKIVLASCIGGLPAMLPRNMLFTPGDVTDCTEKIKSWYAMPAEERQAIGRQLRDEVLQQNNPEEYTKKILELYQK